MSDIMRPIPFGKLMKWILAEYEREGTVFGVSRMPCYNEDKVLPIFNEYLEAPFGPAAGPHTQLAQNIVASYVAGARFFELKTVQIMDGEELSACVNKPCITAGDEAYNCEWSTELTVPQAFDEYVKAWFACKVLSRELGLGDADGFVFNMSVGYDLDGIKSEKIDNYIEGMKEAKDTPIYKECAEWLLDHTDLFSHIDDAFIKSIPSRISDSITESTLHGCPPDEIERIASYLMKEKLLHTYIKCNPTLLGYDYARKRLDTLGFDYIAFDDHHFKEDLQWADAVPMLNRLIALSKEIGVEFGVKLTNTFPVDVKAGELPSEEMYMSGRSLYALTIELAARISEEFDGSLRISYSGGADACNITALTKAGIWPVTMATTVLKPGGYGRFAQIAECIAGSGLKYHAFDGVDVSKVRALSDAVPADPRLQKEIKPVRSRKMSAKLPMTGCFTSPCSEGCPIGQDIPAYLQAMERGDAEEALRIILERNALPFITGTICPHTCTVKCMRNFYEEPLHIRAVKLKAAEEGYEAAVGQSADVASTSSATTPVAIIGAGPAGLAAAYFLSRAGKKVTVFEKTDKAGGVVRHVIPAFRIGDGAIDKDIAICSQYGIEIKYNRNIDNPATLLNEGFSQVIIAVGAWAHGANPLQYGEAADALEFLREVKPSQSAARTELPEGEPSSADSHTSPMEKHHRDVVIIGGGNTAMDAARAAKRLSGTEHVRLVYRRDKHNMPADEEELKEALADGVEFLELLSPVGAKDGQLECEVMRLGDADESGRRAPVPTGEKRIVPADLVIAAVGERVDDAIYRATGVRMNEKGLPVLDANLQTSVKGIYAIGDCKAGPATVVKAIADARKAADAICGVTETDAAAGGKSAFDLSDTDHARRKHGLLCTDLSECGAGKYGTDARCLGCPAICEACVEVCPNRANIAVTVPGMVQKQILHVDGMCNECGNCAVFCPYEGRPYKDKLTLFDSAEDMKMSENDGFLVTADGAVTLRLNGKEQVPAGGSGNEVPEDVRRIIRAVADTYEYLL